MVFAFDRHGTPTASFNAYFFNGLMAAAASLAAALFVKRSSHGDERGHAALASAQRSTSPNRC